MLVETYEQTEVDHEGTPECDAEAIALIEQLGLEGQQKLLRRNEDGDAVQRCPYRKMKADERFIYERICPEKTKLASYADDPIPVRVLQVAAHARDLFDHIYVWHAANADVKDPVLVGMKGSEYSGELFLLARWGEVLEPLSVLAKKACEIFRGEYQAKCAEIIGTVKAKSQAIAEATDQALLSGKMRLPTYYD